MESPNREEKPDMALPTIAFLYNIRHQYPDPGDLASQIETDFDDPQTIEKIIDHFRECGYRVLPIEADREAYLKLYEKRRDIDLAFNYSMGVCGLARYAQMPAMLEILQIPYSGADPLTQAVIMNKARMQDVLAAHGVPVLQSQVFRTGDEPLRRDLSFPLIVKPIAEGSSAGITARSIVQDETELREQVGLIAGSFREPALVQPFLTGREFSIPLLGNPPRTLPIIEPDFSRLPPGYAPLDSLEVKWEFEEQGDEHHLVCPARLTDSLKGRIERTALETWEALDMKDWCRVDMRSDGSGAVYVLDVNSPPGIIPPEVSMTSYFPMAARAAGISYNDLLREVVEIALCRYGLECPSKG